MKDVIIVNPEQLKNKIEQIKKDGVSHLHVVSDFDKTLTKAFIEGQKAHTGIAQIREGKYLTPEYPPKAHALFDYYHPLEISESIPLEEKKKLMLEWWSKHRTLLIESGLNKEVIEDIINKRLVKYRMGVREFLIYLKKHDIPVLIFSAGVGNIIEGSMEKEGMFYNNIHVVSNYFKFDSKGIAIGYSDIIHTFNKNEGQIKKSSYYGKLKDRKNVILLGDGLGDSSMLEGLDHKTIIKIGFLNENAEKLRSQFEKEFDVIILNDGSFDYVNNLLEHILN